MEKKKRGRKTKLMRDGDEEREGNRPGETAGEVAEVKEVGKARSFSVDRCKSDEFVCLPKIQIYLTPSAYPGGMDLQTNPISLVTLFLF